MNERVRAWQSAGELITLAGRRIYVRERDGSGTPVVLLHGYPSSSYDWREVIPLLGDRRIVTFDFLGFGLSDKPRDHVYSLMGQADLVELVVADRLGPQPITLVAHDMGTSVATELLARAVDGKGRLEPATVVLFNGSMVLEAASLTISQKILRSRLGPIAARLSNERSFRAQFARIFSTAHPLTDEEAADQWALLAYNDGHRIIDKLTYYLHERITYAPRWHGALRDWQGDLRLVWAMRDPVCTSAVLEAVQKLRPHAPLTRFEDLGHYPQLEEPERSAGAILSAVAADTNGAERP